MSTDSYRKKETSRTENWFSIKTFDQESNPLKDLTYKDGKKTGLEVTFYENGQLKENETTKTEKKTDFVRSTTKTVNCL